MTPSELLLEGVEIMLFGIGSVYIFLILLIICIRLMSSIISRYDTAPAPRPITASPVSEVAADADILAAIQAAIHQHRARRG